MFFTPQTRTMKVAKALCDISGWTLTNLKLQKILYIAHRVYLGRYNKELVDAPFEAWDYGPVLPIVYNECKIWGRDPIAWPSFHRIDDLDDDAILDHLKEAYEALKERSAASLVAMTHGKGGAWEKVYKPNIKGNVIPKAYIKEEYDDLLARSTTRA